MLVKPSYQHPLELLEPSLQAMYIFLTQYQKCHASRHICNSFTASRMHPRLRCYVLVFCIPIIECGHSCMYDVDNVYGTIWLHSFFKKWSLHVLKNRWSRMIRNYFYTCNTVWKYYCRTKRRVIHRQPFHTVSVRYFTHVTRWRASKLHMTVSILQNMGLCLSYIRYCLLFLKNGDT